MTKINDLSLLNTIEKFDLNITNLYKNINNEFILFNDLEKSLTIEYEGVMLFDIKINEYYKIIPYTKFKIDNKIDNLILKCFLKQHIYSNKKGLFIFFIIDKL